MNIEKFSSICKEKLAQLYDPEEIRSITNLLLMEILIVDRVWLSINKTIEIPEHQAHQLAECLKRLQSGEPIQYITGSTYFYGLRINVNKNVLIPRPETEFLVDLIVQENKESKLHVLDICTGSGCIALALKKSLSCSEVTAVDISEPALQMARENAIHNKLSIDLFKMDILAMEEFDPIKNKFNIVVSNPPYIMEREKRTLHRNVLEFEPSMALFVPDNNPLLFYIAIERLLQVCLLTGGIFYAEIHEKQGASLLKFFNLKGYTHACVKKDIFGKDRYLVVSK